MNESGVPRWVTVSGLIVALLVLLGLAVRLVGVGHGSHHAPSGCHGAP